MGTACRHPRRSSSGQAPCSTGAGRTLRGPVAAPLPSKDEDLTEAVDALPPQQRAAVALYYLEGRPTAEVADLLACSEATVRSHLHRARQQLAAVLGEERQEEVGDVCG